MDAERWARLEELFGEASALPPQEREGFLRAACPDDPALVSEAAALLAAGDDDGGAFIARSILEAAEASPPPPAIAPASPTAPFVEGGKVAAGGLDRYRLIERIGRGGMGEVYLAERADEEFQKEVALKVVRDRAGGREAVERFRRERQILAGLVHPNIAQLLDGGTSEDGRPYLVMEHVEGERIDEYCDRRRLSVRERLELFVTVCRAVEYAHTHLVVHRDVKPANILVTEEGVPKLLDFGIAKLLDPEAFDPLGETVAGVVMMTPDYASPEQVRGEPVTTASDVYSLGVLLYVLLCGRRPYRLSTRRAAELERVIGEQRPERPSTAIGRRETETKEGDVATAESIGQARSSDPHRLRRRLAGDLDNIVLKALEKDPERRYSSVARLADDLRLHLEGRPVSARPPTLWYRAGRFASRHRWALAGTAAALLVLGGLQLDHVRRLEREKSLAQRERETAQRVSEFLVDLFRVSNPGPRRAEDISARELLDEGARRIGRELEDEPLVRAGLESTMGRVYANIGLYDPSEDLLRSALARRRELLSPEDPDLARALGNLAFVHKERGEYEEALALYAEALAIVEGRAGVDPLLVSQLHREVGSLHLRDGQYEKMREHLERALSLRREVQGPDHPEVAAIVTDLGAWRWRTGDFRGAREYLEEALAIRERSFRPEDVRIAGNLHNLGLLSWAMGDYPAARVYYRRALELNETHFGPDNPEVAPNLFGLATTLRELGDLEGSRSIYERLLVLQAETVGAESNHYALTLGGLGFTLLRMEELGEARRVFERAIAVFESSLGPEHLDLGAPLVGLARVGMGEGKLDEAERLLERALAIREEALGPRHAIVGRTLGTQGRLLLLKGDASAALESYHRALDILESAARPDHPHVAEVLEGRAEALRFLGREEEAEPAARRAAAIRSRASESDAEPR